MQARYLTTNVQKILDLKLSSEQVVSKNCRWVPLMYDPCTIIIPTLHRLSDRSIRCLPLVAL